MGPVKHIHELIFLIEQHNRPLTPANLILLIEVTWGADVHFGACSGAPFKKEIALDFLLNRQKVMLTESGKVILHPSIQICQGHETFNT